MAAKRGRHSAVRHGAPYGRRRAVAAGAGLAVVLAIAIPLALSASSASPKGGTPAGGGLPATFRGPDGLEAAWVVKENRLPGTTAWQIPRDVDEGAIEGFADVNDARQGQRVDFYVSTRAAAYTVQAYRMGYYQGKGGRLVWSSAHMAGHLQPACPVTPGVNMVACDNWTRSFSLTIPSDFPQGDYLFKLDAGPRAQAYVPLTVWLPTSHAAYLIMARSFTEQGWNTFGGFSFYQGEGSCAPTYPVCNRARIVSFDRPYDTGNGASDFFGDEYPLVRFCEQHGLDVAYVTDITVTEHPNLVANHQVLLSLGHDESWSYQERVGMDDAVAKGTNVVFFGAASVLRHVRLQASPLGADREEVDYRDAQEDPLSAAGGSPMEITGNTWSSPPTDWSEIPFVGEEYSGYLYPGDTASFVVADAASWVYRGTGLHDGSVLPGVIASDIDHVAPGAGPADLMVLGHSPIPLSVIYTNEGQWGSVTYSDMTYYTFPHGGAGVLDTGNNNWINAMGGGTCPRRGACPIAPLDAITGNILRVFGEGPAGRSEPSRSNLGSIQPSGS